MHGRYAIACALLHCSLFFSLAGVAMPANAASDITDQTPTTNLMTVCELYWTSLKENTLSARDVGAAYNRHVKAENILWTRGPETIPWALGLLQRNDPHARETGAGLLGHLASKNQLGEQREQALRELCAAARNKIGDNDDRTALSVIVGALQEIGDKSAIPLLAEIINGSPDVYSDINWDAALALGKILGEDFSKQKDPVATAKAWLQKNPISSNKP
jgi:hypothetical protein